MLKYEQMEYFSTYCCLYSEYFPYICYQIKKLNYGGIKMALRNVRTLGDEVLRSTSKEVKGRESLNPMSSKMQSMVPHF